jgi:hypothetical protein
MYLALASEVRNPESRVLSALSSTYYVYLSAHSCVASQGLLHETPILVGRETEGPLVDAQHP